MTVFFTKITSKEASYNAADCIKSKYQAHFCIVNFKFFQEKRNKITSGAFKDCNYKIYVKSGKY